jgi:uncharacterized membrane protein
MRPLLVIGACVAAVAAALIGHWVFNVKTERAFALAPVLVVCFGAVLGLVVLWTRVIVDSLRSSEHPRRILAIAAGAIALVALLTALGVELPRE